MRLLIAALIALVGLAVSPASPANADKECPEIRPVYIEPEVIVSPFALGF